MDTIRNKIKTPKLKWTKKPLFTQSDYDERIKELQEVVEDLQRHGIIISDELIDNMMKEEKEDDHIDDYDRAMGIL